MSVSTNFLGKGDNPQARQQSAVLKKLDAKIEKYIWNLGDCESGNNQSAINPKDLDGTSSLGRFQFKTGTFKSYIKKYDLFKWREWDKADWANNIRSGIHQETVIRYMILDPDVDWGWEFPDCSKKYGWPPIKPPVS
jgi:hypothetical protein